MARPLAGRAENLPLHFDGDDIVQFLSMVRINENGSKRPDERLMRDMGKLIEEMTAEGSLLDTAGLRPTVEGKRVRLSGSGRIDVVDGPFTETREVIGGYAILEAPTLERAVELTRRFLAVHGDGWELECEVRQMERGPDGCS